MDKLMTEEANGYLQIMTGREPSIARMEELFYAEVDADRDGNIEIIAAYGEQDLIRICFVLRDGNDGIRIVKQNFFASVYDCHSMELVRFNGSDQYYIAAGVTNYDGMNGLEIYEIAADDVRCISGIQSAAGICCTYLADQQSDGCYGGFITERFGQDVYYYEVLTEYRFADGGFIRLPSRINVKEYPQDPLAVVIQYLSLKCLNRNYFSNDIVERLLEIHDNRFYYYFSLDDMIWGVRLANYALGIDAEEAPGLHITQDIDQDTAVVAVHWSDRHVKEVHQVEFCLVWNRAGWRIADIMENVDTESADGSLQFRTVDMNQTYLGAAGYTELDLRLPELSGSYDGIPKINAYFDRKRIGFHKEMADTVNLQQHRPDHMKGRETNHYRSGDYCFTAKKGNMISIMAYLDGGDGKHSQAGKEGYTFDLVTGDRLKLSDLFSVDEEEYLDILYACIARNIWQKNRIAEARRMNGIQKLDQNNFYLTDYTLVVFGLGQAMAIGGTGVQTFEIPYREIGDLLFFQH